MVCVFKWRQSKNGTKKGKSIIAVAESTSNNASPGIQKTKLSMLTPIAIIMIIYWF